jgi:hypothetical protein
MEIFHGYFAIMGWTLAKARCGGFDSPFDESRLRRGGRGFVPGAQFDEVLAGASAAFDHRTKSEDETSLKHGERGRVVIEHQVEYVQGPAIVGLWVKLGRPLSSAYLDGDRFHFLLKFHADGTEADFRIMQMGGIGSDVS